MRWVLPVGRSPHAIAAGYLGLISPLIPLAAPAAIVLGVLAIRDIRRDPAKHGMGRAVFGIIVGSLVTLLAMALVVAWVVSLG